MKASSIVPRILSVSVCSLLMTTTHLLDQANAAAPLPHSIEVTASPASAPVKCVLRADYVLAGVDLTFELSARSAARQVEIEMKAYTPLVVRDLWLKTDTLFTLGMFPQGRPNTIGTLIVKDRLPEQRALQLLNDLMNNGAEISVISGGTMPTARMAIDLPAPLPDLQATALNDCWKRLF